MPEWEIARRAGSGLFGPHLFDQYSHFAPAPAAVFALSVDRKFSPHIATVRGGGWIASGEPNPDRMPQPVWPAGLKYLPCEGAGEGQSPLTGPAVETVEVGDRVWFRHTKARELSEHLNEFAVVEDGRIIETVPTYRGEGKVCSCDGSFRAFALAPSGATGVAQSVQAPGLLRSRAASMKLLLR